jgi:hypothetical protein
MYSSEEINSSESSDSEGEDIPEFGPSNDEGSSEA